MGLGIKGIENRSDKKKTFMLYMHGNAKIKIYYLVH